MKTLQQEIEDMRAHVKELTAAERAQMKALGDELRRSDEALLRAICRVAAEHEERRSGILGELQALAENAGLLRTSPTGPDAAIANRFQRPDRPAVNPYRQHSPLSLEEEVSYHFGQSRA